MDTNKSQDEVHIIATLLSDINSSLGQVFNTRAYNLTVKKIKLRVRREGIGFITKTMPKLGKAFDKALSGDTPLNSIDHGFKPMANSKLPRFLGELFSCVLDSSGALLPNPCAKCVRCIRELLYLYYKYELPFTQEQEQAVIDKFERTEQELALSDQALQSIAALVPSSTDRRRFGFSLSLPQIVREARITLSKLFAAFDPTDIFPKHGPGAVATKQRLWDKYVWTNISSSITDLYPADAYFYASVGHVCDSVGKFSYTTERLPAQVILVPKDSRGPRLISCEPVDYQWIQQGLSRAIVRHVERHPLTRENVRFTDQGPNGMAALASSRTGKYATLDLNEASDRVSLDLVRLLFPDHIVRYLEACRTTETKLPCGRVLPLRKFAPMGSALCFPILALTVWSLLQAGLTDTDTRDSIYVYGDDVIVPTHYCVNAIERLESFGLKVNRDKSCTKGLFRESCGVDAFNGTHVTPVRLRTVWSSLPSPNVYQSWIAYANSFYDRGYYSTYDYLVGKLTSVYGRIPCDDMGLTVPSLREVPDDWRPNRKRFNLHLQKMEFKVLTIKAPCISREIDGWLMLLRYFTESAAAATSTSHASDGDRQWGTGFKQSHKEFTPIKGNSAFSVRLYTKRNTSMLVKRWR